MTHSKQCPGFKAAGMAAGIKTGDDLDLGLIVSDHPAAVAAVLTRNQVQAAPVQVTRHRVASGLSQAVVVNSGNANCCTGNRGISDAEAMARAAADALKLVPENVCVASTGVIGQALPLGKIEQAMPELAGDLSEDGFEAFSRAILTTDTVPKLVQRQGVIEGQPFTVLATAKGAGMIRPDMATMLCFVCTDAGVTSDVLQSSLRGAVDKTLNRISIDGDTSTNDMVLILANGHSAVTVVSDDQIDQFQRVLNDVLNDIAHQLVQDGEGVTKVVEIAVEGAKSDAEALQIADTVAHSPLVKTAFFGEDANWGRIIAAVGRAGVPLDPDRIDLYFDAVQMARNSVGCGPEAEGQATRVMQQPAFRVTIQLNQGKGRAAVLTCDFSVDYVNINADYRS